MEKLPDKVALIVTPVKDAIDPEILRAHVGTEIGEGGRVRIGRRIGGVWTHVAEAAGHADTVGLHEAFVFVIALVGVVANGIPFLRGGFIEFRIRKEPETDNTRPVAVITTEGKSRSTRTGFHAG